MNIVALKPILKRITKQQLRRELGNAMSNGTDLNVTDLGTYLTLKGLNLPNGLLNINSLGLTNQTLDFDLSDYPSFPDFEVKGSLKVSIKTIEMLLESASNDETRLYLNSVAWIKNELVSTNGYILTLVKDQTNNPTEDSCSILPSDSLKELVQVSKKFKLSEVTIQVGDDFFTVDTDTFKLSGRLIKREYFKYQAVIPVRTSNSMTISKPVNFKTVKDILNRSKGVRLETQDQVTNLVVDGTDFKAEIGTSDFKGTVGFNLKYLEFLTDLDTKLKFNNELSPVMVTKSNVTRIAMPLKV